jgi:hypothetical protein
VKRRYSIGVTVIGLLGCAYAEYRYYHPNIPAIPLWVILLLLTWSLLGYAIYLHRFRRLPSPPVEKPTESTETPSPSWVRFLTAYPEIAGPRATIRCVEFREPESALHMPNAHCLCRRFVGRDFTMRFPLPLRNIPLPH